MRQFCLLSILLVLCSSSSAQQTINQTLVHDGETRNYVIYIPSSYDAQNPAPIVFNFHGFGGNSNQHMNFTNDMVMTSDTAGFILVYPQGTPFFGLPHWNVGSWTAASTVDDVGFTSSMIDTLMIQFNIDEERIYSCGFSNGGYFSYRLACELSNRIAAIGAVGGTMSVETFTDCAPNHPTPVISIHGTNDNVVSYTGTNPINSESQADLINYWTNFNNTSDTPTITSLPDIDPNDGSTVELSRYTDGNFCSALHHFRVNGGAHQWPGANGNMDMNASLEIWKFVSQYDINGKIDCAFSSTHEKNGDSHIYSIFPNPANDFVTITRGSAEEANYKIFSSSGILIGQGRIQNKNQKVDISSLHPGMYFVQIKNTVNKILIKQ